MVEQLIGMSLIFTTLFLIGLAPIYAVYIYKDYNDWL